ncbi:hypothetical protein OROMI_001609 [Orobanche minor]
MLRKEAKSNPNLIHHYQDSFKHFKDISCTCEAEVCRNYWSE